jgi:hypothetical protein
VIYGRNLLPNGQPGTASSEFYGQRHRVFSEATTRLRVDVTALEIVSPLKQVTPAIGSLFPARRYPHCDVLYVLLGAVDCLQVTLGDPFRDRAAPLQCEQRTHSALAARYLGG